MTDQMTTDRPDAAGGYGTSEGGPSGPRAGFWRRFGGAFIDSILVGIVNGLLTATLKGTGYAIALVISIAYYTYCEGGPKGQTIGKMAVGIRVISFDNGGPIGYGRAFIRWVGRILSAIVFFLGYFWMLWDSEKQCWHDKLAGDVVVPVSDYPVR